MSGDWRSFTASFFGLQYRPGDEPAAEGEPDDADWLVLTDGQDSARLAFQLVDRLDRTTWSSPDVPMQMHLDLTVPDRESLEHQHSRAPGLGAELRFDRTDDPDEPL